MESLVLKFPKSAFSRRSFPSKPPANQLLVWELPQKYFCSIIQHSAARAHIKYIACFFHVDFTFVIDNYIVVMFSTFFFHSFMFFHSHTHGQQYACAQVVKSRSLCNADENTCSLSGPLCVYGVPLVCLWQTSL